MEPFGLLNLLKSLLPQTENSAKTDGAHENAEPLKSTLQNGGQSPDGATHTPSNTSSTPSPQSENGSEQTHGQNACLECVHRHDARTKNVKKR